MAALDVNYYAVVFVQALSLVFFVCSWVPLWQKPRIGVFHVPSVNRAFFHHGVMLATLLPGALALQAGIAELIVHATDDRHNTVATIYALIVVQMALFSVWLVPYASLREAWWSLLALVACLVIGVGYMIAAGVGFTNHRPRVVTWLALWNAALFVLAVFLGLTGVLNLSSATMAARPRGDRTALVYNLMTPVNLVNWLWHAHFDEANVICM